MISSMISSSSSLFQETPPSSQSNFNPSSAKTSQVILETLYKSAEMILFSRIPSLSFTTKARTRFQLNVPTNDTLRAECAAWKENIHAPFVLDIVYDKKEDDKEAYDEEYDYDYHETKEEESPFTLSACCILLEQWTFEYIETSDLEYLEEKEDILLVLRKLCKPIGVYLRALFVFIRLLPAQGMFAQRRGGKNLAIKYVIQRNEADETAATQPKIDFNSDSAVNR